MRGQISFKNNNISYIQLKTLHLFGIVIAKILIIILSLGILTPIALVIWERFICNRRYINGRKLKFVGEIKDLYLKYLKWYLLTLITFGVYGLWASFYYKKWKIKNTVFEDSNTSSRDSEFMGRIGEFILLNITSFIIFILTLGILTPWIISIRNRWSLSHTYINGEHLEFLGSANDLVGYYFLWLFLSLLTLGLYSFKFIKNIIEWSAVNQKINNETRVVRLKNILHELYKNNKIIFVPLLSLSVVFLIFIVFLASYLNKDFIVKEGVLLKYKGEETEVVIPDDVYIIGEGAFSDNKYIKNITIPSRIMSIGKDSFKNCINLETVRIEEGVKTIGKGAFSDSLNLRIVVIPKSVLIIEPFAFSGILYLTIYANIDKSPFYWDSSTYRNAVVMWGVDGVDENYEYAYKFVTDIDVSIVQYLGNNKELTIPDKINGKTVIKIGNGAFNRNFSIKNVIIPDSIIDIESEAFAMCENLESITLSKNIKEIKPYTFYECTNLKSITIPKNVESIYEFAFYGCKNLREVYIPDNVKSIQTNTFIGSKNLTAYCEPTSKPASWEDGWIDENSIVVWSFKLA